MAINYINNKIVVYCWIDSASVQSPYSAGFYFDVSNDIYSERLDAVYLYLSSNRLSGRMIIVPAEEIYVSFDVVYDDSGRLRRIRLNEDINETGLYLVVKYPAVWNTADEAFLELADKVPEALVFDTYGEISFPFHYSEIQTEKEREIWWSVLGFTKDQLRNDVELQGKVKNKWKVAKEL